MIGIIAKNNLMRQTLYEALQQFNPVIYETGEHPFDLIVIYHHTDFLDGFFKTPVPCPVLLIGASHDEADYCIPTPCRLNVLQQTVKKALENAKNAPVFENEFFIFNSKKRELTHKHTEEVFHLTEKENALISYLATKAGQSVSKEELLSSVWNYHPNAETHTVESHIYALKQKIGLDNSCFIQSNDTGYYLVK